MWELKHSGLNEVVCAEVLKSMSKKRSHSGDSEETFSEGSREASLEASEVAVNGGKKSKKAKKAKKAKASDASVKEVGASKPASFLMLPIEHFIRSFLSMLNNVMS
ncbi:hypothetical protein Hanom_Chr11g01048571 [Helianthus anomalus]